MQKNDGKLQKVVIAIFFLVSLIPVIGIAFFNHPCADDFNYSIYTHNVIANGGNIIDVLSMAVKTSRDFMYSWQGLYSSAFLLALQPGIWGEGFYWLTTVIMIVLIYGGTMFLIRNLCRYVLKDTTKNWIWIATILTFFFIHTMPFPVEGLYWYNGAMNYIFFWAALMFIVSQYIVLLVNEKVLCRTLIITLTAFVLSGGNHIMAFAALLVELTIGIYLVIRQKKYLSLIPFVAGLAGFVWNITSAGTVRRRGQLAYSGNPIKTMVAATVRQIMILNDWINFALLILFVLLTPFLYRMIKNNKDKMVYKGKTLLFLFFALAALMMAMWCVPYQAMGNFGSGRLRNILYMSFVVMLVVLYSYALGMLAQTGIVEKIADSLIKKENCHKKWNKFGTSMLAVLVMGILFVFGGSNTDYGTGMEAIMEISIAKQYDSQIEGRLTVLHETDAEDVVLSPLTVWPQLLYFDDIETDTTNWKNVSFASYYGKASVKIGYQ